ncbi:hypothetical protein CRE_04993 [Caenorhabditis remanei]|uniref:Uncharacterized protein n=1 Tax=Caenorhabditis remanei TaxID=31234 RepID=E3MNC9_CAERE|nr:hypothetical protein CRE_04993 [Caenorhabditis remanei]
MYIGWIHHYIPKLLGFLAFIVNPVFVYLVFSGKSICLGNYRFLLLYFASFNVIYSTLEIAVPIGISGYRYCFYLLLTDGPFEKASSFNHFVLTVRCSMLASSYSILISHFVFRYLVILRSKYSSTRFRFFMTGSFGLCAAYVLFFAWVCESWLYAPKTVKSYIRRAFREEYGADPADFNMLSAIYNVSKGEASGEDEFRSWTGVLMLVFMSSASISTYVFFGYKIMRKLNDSRSHTMMSQETAVLQRKLLIALTVQTIIPICISFMPSLVAWFSPVFNYNIRRLKFQKFR